MWPVSEFDICPYQIMVSPHRGLTGLPYSDAPELIFCENKKTKQRLLNDIFVDNYYVWKKEEAQCKTTQKLQPPNPKSGFFVPNSGFLCVPNLLCSIHQEDLLWKSGLLPVKTNKQSSDLLNSVFLHKL